MGRKEGQEAPHFSNVRRIRVNCDFIHKFQGGMGEREIVGGGATQLVNEVGEFPTEGEAASQSLRAAEVQGWGGGWKRWGWGVLCKGFFFLGGGGAGGTTSLTSWKDLCRM